MNSSKRETKGERDPLRFFSRPALQSPSLVVAWSEDAGRLGPKVNDYLRRKLGGHSFCEIEPVDFFPMGGVAIEDDLAKFPASWFYASPEHDLVLFESSPPSSDWYRFLNLVMDVAEHYCHVREVHTVGGMVAISAHTTPRQLVAAFSSTEAKKNLSSSDLVSAFDYETAASQRPTLSSYLLWVAKRRSIPAASLWVPVPFYLAGGEDLGAERRVLQFIDQRLDLGIDFRELDEDIKRQNRELAEARAANAHIEESIARLESNQGLSDEESLRLVEEVDEFIKSKREQAS
jgi:predicted ATP-grasp superfamily ATP-dependent carboligase